MKKNYDDFSRYELFRDFELCGSVIQNINFCLESVKGHMSINNKNVDMLVVGAIWYEDE